MTVKILYLILSCKYFLRISTKTTFISTETWKVYQLIRGHVVFLFSFDTYDVVRSWSIFLLPSIELDNLFGRNHNFSFYIDLPKIKNIVFEIIKRMLGQYCTLCRFWWFELSFLLLFPPEIRWFSPMKRINPLNKISKGGGRKNKFWKIYFPVRGRQKF